LASRDLFNQHYLPPPHPDFSAWDAFELFDPVEDALFQTLVAQSAGLTLAPYGSLNPKINVCVQSDTTPIMINREQEKDHGYWDYPIAEVSRSATMKFVRFFDFDGSRDCDHQYVHVEISDWPLEKAAVGRRALVENQYVSFELAPTVPE
jgi:hypothetical protein